MYLPKFWRLALCWCIILKALLLHFCPPPAGRWNQQQRFFFLFFPLMAKAQPTLYIYCYWRPSPLTFPSSLMANGVCPERSHKHSRFHSTTHSLHVTLILLCNHMRQCWWKKGWWNTSHYAEQWLLYCRCFDFLFLIFSWQASGGVTLAGRRMMLDRDKVYKNL